MNDISLKAQLLDLLSSQAKIEQSDIARLSDVDWAHMLAMAHQHRMLPELHWCLRQSHAHLSVPDAIAGQLASAFEQSTLRSLVLQRELLRIHGILQSADIPHVMLKGAYLAFYCYPNPGQRPLRDVDVFVPKEHALRAYRALCDAGMSPAAHSENAAQIKLDQSGDAPDLFTPSNILIELHAKLFSKELLSENHTDLSKDTGFWQRIIYRQMGNAQLPFLSSTDLLLHLIVHAAYDHHFNNGPLTFSDIAYLLVKNQVDWSLFWRLADFTGSMRGCVLVLRATESLHGDLGIDWSEIAENAVSVSANFLERVRFLSLNDLRNKDNFLLRADLSVQRNFRSRFLAVFRRIFPSRKVMSETFLVPENSPYIYVLYPVKWYTILFKRIPNIVSAGQVIKLRDEQLLLDEYKLWLSKN